MRVSCLKSGWWCAFTVVVLLACSSNDDDKNDAGLSCTTGGLYCESNAYCDRPVGACDMPAFCKMKTTDECAVDVTPVCGCDGNTYSSVCAANQAGTSVASQGACDS